ncbi:hypothetical protein Tco_0818910 [Tanacetum coccineum]
MLEKFEAKKKSEIEKIKAEYTRVISFRVNPQPTLQHPSRKQAKLKDTLQLLSNLAHKFIWIRNTTNRLNIPPPDELLKVNLPPKKKKQLTQGRRNKRTRVQFEHMFFTKEPIVPGGERNITPLEE